jgi:WD40 repeat protein
MKWYLQGSNSIIRVRDWETDSIKATIRDSNIQKAIFSPDGKQIAALVNEGKNIKVWDSVTGQEFLTIDGSGVEITTFCYSHDGKNMLFKDFEKVIVFDLVNKRQLRSFSVKVTDGNSPESVFSPDGKLYIMAITTVSYGNYQGSIKIYDTNSGKELKTLSGHTSFVMTLVCSPDGKKTISVDSNNVMKIWDVETGRELKSSKLEYDFIQYMDYSADNKKFGYIGGSKIIVLDTGTYRELLTIESSPDLSVNSTKSTNRIITTLGGAVQQWDIGTGRRLENAPSAGIMIDEIFHSPNNRYFAAIAVADDIQKGVNDLKIFDRESNRLIRTLRNNLKMFTREIAWSPDNRKITAFSSAYIENICLFDVWDVEKGQHILRFQHSNLATSGSQLILEKRFSPDGMRIFYRFADSIQVWVADSDRKILTINGTYIFARWSPDGRHIVTGSRDGSIKIWNALNGQEIRSSIRHGNLSTLVYTPDGKTIITGGEKNIIAWNVETGKKLWEGSISDNVSAVETSMDGKMILAKAEDSSISLISVINENIMVQNFDGKTNSASFSADGKWIVTGSEDGTVRVWSAETFVEKARFIAFNDGEWLAMTPDGYYNASANGGKYLNARVGNTVTGIDRYRSTFNKPAVLAARLSNSGRMTHDDTIVSVAVNPGGTRIASVAHDKLIKLWDLESGRLLRTITNIGGYANAVSFSPDGRRLIHGAEDKSIRIWDAETGAAVRTITGHTDYVNEARYSPDGRRIASCADDKLIKIWDAETGREIRSLSGHTDLVCVVAWSPDGRRIASGSDAKEKAIRIWDAESGRLLQTITGQGGRIYTLAYSPDGKKIASAALEDKAVKIWDAETGRLIRSIPVEDNGGVYSLAWSPDGKRLTTGAVYGGDEDYGNHIEIWNAETGENIRTIWERGGVYSLAFTPDGRRIVAGCTFSDARFVRVYDALTGEEL